MNGRVVVNGGGGGSRPSASSQSNSFTGRSYIQRSNSRPSSPERTSVKEVRRSQSATLAMNNLTRFHEPTIRPVMPDHDTSTESGGSPTTPPRTPTSRSSSRHARDQDEPRTSQIPLPTRKHSYSNLSNGRHPSIDKVIDLRRGRAMPHSPSSSTDDRDISPSRTLASALSELSTSTSSYQSFRNRSYASNSPVQSSPSSPLPPSISPGLPTNNMSPQIPNTNILPGSIPRAQTPKSSSKLYKQRTLRSHGSNSTIQSVRTTDSISNVRSPPPGGDASKVLGLMKEVRGKMEGVLEYRIGDSLTWSRGYCIILEETGHLVHVREDRSQMTVIGDLRGCQIRTSGSNSDEYEGIIEVSTFTSRQDVRLRPMNSTQYDLWLAALLCWQPIRPAGMHNKMVKTQQLRLANDRKMDRRRNSDATVLKDAAIIKVGKMMMWDRSGTGSIIPAVSATSNPSKPVKSGKVNGPSWRKISCILQENGEFKLYNESDVALLSVVQLSQLSRCAIQQLDPSVLGQEHCIAIYPQFTPASTFPSPYPSSPIYLALDSRILYEVWFVLLRAYTVPEMYGPAGLTTSQATSPQTPLSDGFDFGLNNLNDAFRVPRLLNMRIIEAKIPKRPVNLHAGSDGPIHTGLDKKDTEVFLEIFIDGDIRARTMPRTKTTNLLWMEQFEFNELPAQLETIELILKQRSSKHKRDRGPTSSNGNLSTYANPTGEIIGKVSVSLKDLEFDTESEAWWPITHNIRGTEERVGEVMLKLRKEELVVLMMEEYKPLLELLQNFHNGLTVQIGQVVSSDLRRLGHTLLKIFQVSGKAVDWLTALTEAEIDGLYKENSVVKYNFPVPGVSVDHEIQMHLFDNTDSSKREGMKQALMEANILFRGNSLLTKAVEAHMKRFGKEYMDDTVAQHVRRIAEEDLYCEVDPMKCKSAEDRKNHWKTLMALVKAVWQSIYISSGRCPAEVRRVLYHVRMCVEDKYGDMLRGVSYSSVSGFLFLRFFCPAVLNPKLFGILKDHPGAHAQRTLTLVAKGLQGLANMTTFGVKEPWMEPMNEFLVDHSAEFRKFIDAVSNVQPSPYQTIQVPPSYATPITIQARLPQASKEGFPSLPFLIDQPRAIARLVTMWLKWHEHQSERGYVNLSGDLFRFHELCLHLKDRMTTCVERAENAERPGSGLSNRWEEVADGMGDGRGSPTPLYLEQYPTSAGSMNNGGGGRMATYTSGGVSYQRNIRHGSNASSTVDEERDEYAGVAALGKSKLSDFVVGIRRKVKRQDDWRD